MRITNPLDLLHHRNNSCECTLTAVHSIAHLLPPGCLQDKLNQFQAVRYLVVLRRSAYADIE
jgi:hypothetical protein